MTTIEQYQEITSHADNTVEDITSIRNIAKDPSDGYYYWLEVDGTDIHVMKTNDFSGASAADETSALGDTCILLEAVVREFDGDLYGFAVMERVADDFTRQYWFKRIAGVYSWTYGTAWDDPASAINESCDVIIADGVVSWLGMRYVVGSTINTMQVNAFNGTNLDNINFNGGSYGYYSGYYTDEGHFDLIFYQTGAPGANFYLCEWDGSSLSFEILSGPTAPSTFDSKKQQYWKEGNNYFLLDTEYHRFKNTKSTDWFETAASSGNTDFSMLWKKINNLTYSIENYTWDGVLKNVSPEGAILNLMSIRDRDYKREVSTQLLLDGVIDWGNKRRPKLESWTDSPTHDTFEVIKVSGVHQNPIHAIGDTGDILSYTPSTQTTGTIELWMRVASVTNQVNFRLVDSSANLLCEVIFETDGNIDFQGTALDGDLVAYAINTWYHIKIVFTKNSDCTLTVNGTLLSTLTTGNYDLERIQFVANSTDVEYWFDAIGFSWDSYVAGSNRNIAPVIGYDTWFSSGDGIFEQTFVDFPIDENCVIRRIIYESPTCALVSTRKPFVTQFLKMYDGDDAVFFGQVMSFISNAEEKYTYNVKSGIKDDLEQKITVSYTAKTVNYIYNDILSTCCDHLHNAEGTNGLVNVFTALQIDGTDTNWTNNDGSANTLSTHEEEVQLINGIMKNVLQEYDNDGAARCKIVNVNITGKTVFSGWFANDDANLDNGILFYEGATRIGILRIISDKIQWYNGAAQDIKDPVVDNTKYHWACVFTLTSVDIYVDGVFISTESLENNITTEIDEIRFQTASTSSAYTIYHSDFYKGNSIIEALNTYESVSTLPVTTYTIVFKSKSVRDIFKWADAVNGYVTMFGNNDQLYYDQYRPALNLTEITDSDMTQSDVNNNIITVNQLFSKAVIYGGYKDGSQISITKWGSPNFGTWTDWYPEETDILILEDLIDQVITDRNITFNKVTPVLHDIGVIQMGEYVNIDSTSLGEDGTEDWLIHEIMFNPLLKEVQPTLADAFFQGLRESGANVQIRNNEQNIGAAQESIQLSQSGMITLSDGDATPDISSGSIFITPSNTGATAITDLDNPTAGQIIKIVIGNASNPSTIADGAPFYLSGAWGPGLYDSITLLILDTTHFIELSRVNV